MMLWIEVAILVGIHVVVKRRAVGIRLKLWRWIEVVELTKLLLVAGIPIWRHVSVPIVVRRIDELVSRRRVGASW